MSGDNIVYVPEYIADEIYFGMVDKTTNPPTMTLEDFSRLENDIKIRLLSSPEFEKMNPKIFGSKCKAPKKIPIFQNRPRQTIGNDSVYPPDLSDLTNDSKIKFCVRELFLLFQNYPYIRENNTQIASVIDRVYDGVLARGRPLTATEKHLKQLNKMNPYDCFKFLVETLITKLREIGNAKSLDERLLLETLERN